MAFNPDGTIWLSRVDFDNTYKNVRFFETKELRDVYLTTVCAKKTLSNYYTIREPLRNGGARSKIRCELNIEELRTLGVNYLVYCNEHHGTRKFCAFITDLIYVNENMTEIEFETDVFQTWIYDCNIKESFVVREHSMTDGIGDNIVPESFDFKSYYYAPVSRETELTSWCYLLGVNTLPEDDLPSAYSELKNKKRGYEYAGIYQGLYFFMFDSENEINPFIEKLEEQTEDAIMFITVIPTFCKGLAKIGIAEAGELGFVGSTETPAEHSFTIVADETDLHFEGYEPKNKKLFTAPFFCLYATNHNGQQVEYRIEDFITPGVCKFKMYGDICASPSVMYVPQYYAGTYEDPDFGISVNSFPQCSFNSDTYKLWFAKNQYAVGANNVLGIASIIGGLGLAAATAYATGGFGVTAFTSAVGSSAIPMGTALGAAKSLAPAAAMVVGGIKGVHDAFNSVHEASFMPNKVNQGNCTSNLLTAMKKNDVMFYWQKIRRNMAESIDSFFTMYGYQTNKLKIPNTNARKYFSYVQTVGVNIVPANNKGAPPNDDMATLKSIFDNGVTLWKSNAVIGDYSVDNSPT